MSTKQKTCHIGKGLINNSLDFAVHNGVHVQQICRTNQPRQQKAGLKESPRSPHNQSLPGSGAGSRDQQFQHKDAVILRLLEELRIRRGTPIRAANIWLRNQLPSPYNTTNSKQTHATRTRCRPAGGKPARLVSSPPQMQRSKGSLHRHTKWPTLRIMMWNRQDYPGVPRDRF